MRIPAVCLAAAFFIGWILWMRCGLHGCPDVARLNGYVPDRASVLVDHRGREIGHLFSTRRTIVRLEQLPAYVPDAFVAVEDKRFWQHRGIDWVRVVSAAVQNLRAGGIESGSSTITMQVARNVFPERLPAHQRTMKRKLSEARVAQPIQRAYTKQQILELYLNRIYFGNGAYGVEAAAEEYFGKHAVQLTLAEAATLAALPRAPSEYNPRANAQVAQRERNFVLQLMAAQNKITDEMAALAARSALVMRRGVPRTNADAPYFVQAVRRQLEQVLGGAMYTEGYTIETTLDVELQRIADEELRDQLCSIESGLYGPFPHLTYIDALGDTLRPGATPYLQAAVVFMEPRSGDVRALIGGRDYVHSQYDRAVRARRQPASLFKPFVFAAALAEGYPPSMQLDDRPLHMRLAAGGTWAPQNEDGIYAGTLTMRQALAVSSNVATVRLANRIGLRRINEWARRFGVTGEIPELPSTVLGSISMTPLEVTSAYATFATLGQRPAPRVVKRVLNADGDVVWENRPATTRVLDPPVAFVLNEMMKDVIDRGSATSIRDAGYRGVAAGKTGTSNNAVDAWFVGYTADIVGTIWLGFDEPKAIVPRGKAGELVAPMWGRIMQRWKRDQADWTPPRGVETRLVDEHGNVYANECSGIANARTEFFVEDTAPDADCTGGRDVPAGRRRWLARFWKR